MWSERKLWFGVVWIMHINEYVGVDYLVIYAAHGLRWVQFGFQPISRVNLMAITISCIDHFFLSVGHCAFLSFQSE